MEKVVIPRELVTIESVVTKDRVVFGQVISVIEGHFPDLSGIWYMVRSSTF